MSHATLFVVQFYITAPFEQVRARRNVPKALTIRGSSCIASLYFTIIKLVVPIHHPCFDRREKAYPNQLTHDCHFRKQNSSMVICRVNKGRGRAPRAFLAAAVSPVFMLFLCNHRLATRHATMQHTPRIDFIFSFVFFLLLLHAMIGKMYEK